METILCGGDDCFNKVEVSDFVVRRDGTIHRLSKLCWDCITPAQRKSLKRYKKDLRHQQNQRSTAARNAPKSL